MGLTEVPKTNARQYFSILLQFLIYKVILTVS